MTELVILFLLGSWNGSCLSQYHMPVLEVAILLGSHWPKPYAPHCFLVSCQMELACVYVCQCHECMWEKQRQERLEMERDFPSVREFFNCFQEIYMSFSDCSFFFLNHFFSAMNDCVIFIVVVEPQGEHWQFWQDYEARRISWGKYYHVLCKSFLILLSS